MRKWFIEEWWWVRDTYDLTHPLTYYVGVIGCTMMIVLGARLAGESIQAIGLHPLDMLVQWSIIGGVLAWLIWLIGSHVWRSWQRFEKAIEHDVVAEMEAERQRQAYNRMMAADHKDRKADARRQQNAERSVYFIVDRTRNIVKIGYSREPYKRLASLQTGSATKLELAAVTTGGMATEARLHQHYAQYRLEGEWFELSDEIAEHIAQLQQERQAKG